MANDGEMPSGDSSGSKGKSIILYFLLLLNMCFVGGVGAMLFFGQKHGAEATKTGDGSIGQASSATAPNAKPEAHEEDSFVSLSVPLETFLVNLADKSGNRVLKVNMDLEGEGFAEELLNRKSQIRDVIISFYPAKPMRNWMMFKAEIDCVTTYGTGSMPPSVKARSSGSTSRNLFSTDQFCQGH